MMLLSLSCADCRRANRAPLRDCPGRRWFSYGDIRYCSQQMRWGLAHFDILEAGIWPSNPDGGSYVDPIARVQARQAAPFVTAADFFSEIDVRLKRCGEDGQDLLNLVLENGADTFLTGRAKTALSYISGSWRKRMSYREWKGQRRYRRQNARR